MVSPKALKFAAIALAVTIVFAPSLSQADEHHGGGGRHGGDHHRHYSYHNRPDFGFRLDIIPNGCFSVFIGGARFYYSDGIYYQRYGREYVIVHPPIGAVVRRIPYDYRPVIINGVTYYTDQGIYYVHTRSGYQVVPAPVVYVQAPPVIIPTAPGQSAPLVSAGHSTPVTFNLDDSYTLNIPNEKLGGYTEVTIKRSGKGFVGPQGEFYPEFPRVAQLKAMYLQ